MRVFTNPARNLTSTCDIIFSERHKLRLAPFQHDGAHINILYVSLRSPELKAHHGELNLKFLNFLMPENFVEIYLQFKQRGQTLGYFVTRMQME